MANSPELNKLFKEISDSINDRIRGSASISPRQRMQLPVPTYAELESLDQARMTDWLYRGIVTWIHSHILKDRVTAFSPVILSSEFGGERQLASRLNNRVPTIKSEMRHSIRRLIAQTQCIHDSKEAQFLFRFAAEYGCHDFANGTTIFLSHDFSVRDLEPLVQTIAHASMRCVVDFDEASHLAGRLMEMDMLSGFSKADFVSLMCRLRPTELEAVFEDFMPEFTTVDLNDLLVVHLVERFVQLFGPIELFSWLPSQNTNAGNFLFAALFNNRYKYAVLGRPPELLSASIKDRFTTFELPNRLAKKSALDWFEARENLPWYFTPVGYHTQFQVNKAISRNDEDGVDARLKAYS